ncbi:hypothetical protein [Brevundimonas balnearis]|uniref:Uncharacterized protein n=1 Tax=Brevundimonas balnearis TaxID=1572858 RepID=A0ABV6R407_9CAUL
MPAVGETAPAILGAPGGRSFVFGARRLVEAIDTDGAIWLVSGTVEPEAEVTLNAAGGLSLTVRADAAGAWQAQVPAEPSLVVRSGARSATVSPRFAESPDVGTIAYLESPQGVSFAWRLPDGAVQRTWTPAG